MFHRQGNIFYYNNYTGESVWEMPESLKAKEEKTYNENIQKQYKIILSPPNQTKRPNKQIIKQETHTLLTSRLWAY